MNIAARWVRCGDEEYPARLREVRPAVPAYWIAGRALVEMPRAVAVVGARNATPYGLEVARTIARGLVYAGCVVVSGMARGVDAAAHDAALDAGGETIAVLGTGIDVPFPQENADLYARIREAGAVVTEQPPGARGFKANFPKRNRIIAGLSLAVVVVQASVRSGALSTAAHARENNREVLAVPGDVRSPLSAGTHALLRDGAAICTTPEDVLDVIAVELARLPAARSADAAAPDDDVPAGLSPLEQAVLRATAREPCEPRDVAARAHVSKAQAVRALDALEMTGLVRALPANRYMRR